MPKWTLFVQIMPENEAFTVPYHPFDLTRVWPHQDYLLKVCDNRVCCGLSYRH